MAFQSDYHLVVLITELNIFKWDLSIVISYFVHYYLSFKKVRWNMQNVTKNGKQQKPIFGSISKVLCLTWMNICLSICLLNYITLCYSIFSTISFCQLPFKKSVIFWQCRLKHIKNISGTFKITHSNYFPRTSKYLGWSSTHLLHS